MRDGGGGGAPGLEGSGPLLINYCEVPSSGQVGHPLSFPSLPSWVTCQTSMWLRKETFYEFPWGEGWGLPKVLISHERNISHISCKLSCR